MDEQADALFAERQRVHLRVAGVAAALPWGKEARKAFDELDSALRSQP